MLIERRKLVPCAYTPRCGMLANKEQGSRQRGGGPSGCVAVGPGLPGVPGDEAVLTVKLGYCVNCMWAWGHVFSAPQASVFVAGSREQAPDSPRHSPGCPMPTGRAEPPSKTRPSTRARQTKVTKTNRGAGMMQGMTQGMDTRHSCLICPAACLQGNNVTKNAPKNICAQKGTALLSCAAWRQQSTKLPPAS